MIAALLNELSLLANWISLIERSHLGEFSWPFAEELNRIARSILSETDMSGMQLEPIIHVVAEGLGYRIIYEPRVPAASGRRRFVIVAFPRSLKHNVLLHSIFGHEICHTAIYTTTAGGVLHGSVVPALTAAGPLRSEADVNTWLHDGNAPQEVKNLLADFQSMFGQPFGLPDAYREQWLIELICDLFGLILFGPAFLAAHKALLLPMHPLSYGVDLMEPTHPPYAVRHKMLVRAMHLIGWNAPVTTATHGLIYNGEKELLAYLLDDPYVGWASVFTDGQLRQAIGSIQTFFQSQPGIGHSRSKPEQLTALVGLLNRGIPPVRANVDVYSSVVLEPVDISEVLYAGWLCWIGRKHFVDRVPIEFFVTNRLCDHALLQQQAINLSFTPGDIEWQSWDVKR
jgi:hypothetical protein